MPTKIEWASTINNDGSVTPGETWNPLIGCTKISKGCENCFAIRTAWIRQHNPKMKEKYEGTVVKTKNGSLNWTGKINMHNLSFAKPLKQKKPTTYFVNSMSDLFHESVPFEFIKEVYEIIAKCQRHTFQILTKRPEIAESFYKEYPQFAYMRNCWLGTSVENQTTAYERIPALIRIPTEIRFLSCEPLLGPLNISPWLRSDGICQMCGGEGKVPSWLGNPTTCGYCNGEDSQMQGLSPISWVIYGGESGSKARGVHPDWFRSLRDQCLKYKIPQFFKQWGEYYTAYQTMTTGEPVFKMYHSYLHFQQKDWVNKGDICLSIDGTRCEIGFDFSKCAYPVVILSKVGKKKAGNLLDGIEYKQLPVVLP